MTDQPAAQPTAFSLDDLAAAEKVFDLEFTLSERELMCEGVQEHRAQYEAMRAIPLPNSLPPAFAFDPRLSGMRFETMRQPFVMDEVPVSLPANLDAVAFWPVSHLAHLIRTRQITSVALTEMYLERLKRYDPLLHCVVTLTEDRALDQARRADAEIAAGQYRGPLHGIPWGAKDLLAVRGFRTTWGAEPYRDQMIDLDATVVERLDAAGAVLVVKLSVGALAWGDVWLDGQLTRNPWDTERGSSGSSAGSASATAAGLVGFAIGTETLGSIVSPCTECRVTGLRPTFGRVSRHGAMALSWTMDKIGPICRTVEDSALVFNAIYGPDGKDLTVTDYPFNWNPGLNVTGLRIGYVQSAFDEDHDQKAQDDQALGVLRSLGLNLIPISLPDYSKTVYEGVASLLDAEAAACFDELTRSNRDDMLARQVKDAWPNVFRQARLIPAVEYIQANRVRMRMMQDMESLMAGIDVYVAPSFVGNSLVLTNLTGHPVVVVPNGVTEKGTSSSITFTGGLYGEAAALAVARAYQDATSFHQQHPVVSLPGTDQIA